MLDRVEDRASGGQSISQFLFRRRARFLQMIRANIERIPLWHLGIAPGNHVADQAHAWLRREDICAARKIFLDNIVLGCAAQFGAIITALVSQGHIKRQQPRGRRIDRHRCVHVFKRQLIEQDPHVAKMTNRNTDFPNLAARQDMIGIIGCLRRQIERDRQTGLTFGEVASIQFVRLQRG